MQDVARQAWSAAYAMRPTAELQRSASASSMRARRSGAGPRRDLHDELAPTLTGSGTPGCHRARWTRPTQRLPRCCQSWRWGCAARSWGDIRRLVYELRPGPALDELGTGRRAERTRRRIQFPGLERAAKVIIEGTRALAAAASRGGGGRFSIVQEALLNVARHAHASQCIVEVNADGVGIPGPTTRWDWFAIDARAGVGVRRTLHDRTRNTRRNVRRRMVPDRPPLASAGTVFSPIRPGVCLFRPEISGALLGVRVTYCAMNSSQTSCTEPECDLYRFTVAELSRLAIYRAAIRAGFYTDSGGRDRCCGRSRRRRRRCSQMLSMLNRAAMYASDEFLVGGRTGKATNDCASC